MADIDQIEDRLISVMIAGAWERAKGELRSIVALAGSSTRHAPYSEEDARYRYQVISEAVEDFIRDFEEHEHHG